jgi:hypothetical protein
VRFFLQILTIPFFKHGIRNRLLNCTTLFIEGKRIGVVRTRNLGTRANTIWGVEVGIEKIPGVDSALGHGMTKLASATCLIQVTLVTLVTLCYYILNKN